MKASSDEIAALPKRSELKRAEVERAEGPSSESSRRALDGDGVEVGFPWWAVIWGAAAVGLGWFLLVPPRKKRKDDSGEAG